MLNKNQKGFTLIELLIVIVIIGILAGVLVAIIDPAKQQNRARDANVRASMNKVALATQGFVSAYGHAPNDSEMLGALINTYDAGQAAPAACSGNDQLSAASICTFYVTGSELDPLGCQGNGWNNSGGTTGSPCYFRYWRPDGTVDATRVHFKLYAKSWGAVRTVFMYWNGNSIVADCDSTTVADADTAACL